MSLTSLSDNLLKSKLYPDSAIGLSGLDALAPESFGGDPSTLSMRQAVDLSKSENYKGDSHLSADQKELVARVQEERKTFAGRKLTEQAAEDGVTLRMKDDLGLGVHGLELDKEKRIELSRDSGQNALHHALVLHHENTHRDQVVKHTDKAPQDLSSYDKKIWSLGREGQAFVAEKDEESRHKTGKGLTDEKKREYFAEYSKTEGYADYYDINNSTRTDGRKLTKQEDLAKFENAFGTVPGHEKEGNYLKGHYNDAADIYDAKSNYTVFHDAYKEAIGVTLSKSQLPKAKENEVRIDSKDGNTAIYVSHEKDNNKAHVVVYHKKELPGGALYVQVENKDVDVNEAKANPRNPSYFYYPTSPSPEDSRLIVNVSRDGQVKATEVEKDGHKITQYASISPKAPMPKKFMQEEKIFADNNPLSNIEGIAEAIKGALTHHVQMSEKPEGASAGQDSIAGILRENGLGDILKTMKDSGVSMPLAGVKTVPGGIALS